MPRVLSELRLYICNACIARVPLHTIRLAFYRHVMGFDIAPTATIFMNATFDCARGFSLGKDSIINARCRLDNRGGLRIGDHVSISDDCILLTADHDPRDPKFSGRLKETVIENYVWIGVRSTLFPGVRLGEGCVVGAGSIVTKDVEPFSIVAGNPSRKIGERPRGLNYQTCYRRLFH